MQLRRLKQSEWNELFQQLMAVEEAEADFGRPIGEHYKLANLLDRLFNVHVNKENMTQTDQEKLQRLHEIRASWLAWRLTYPHTYPELRDPHLRSILANELWVLRRRMKEIGVSMTSESVGNIRMGLETFARRVEAVQKHGLKTIYAENFENSQAS